jgi:hypothetical protein
MALREGRPFPHSHPEIASSRRSARASTSATSGPGLPLVKWHILWLIDLFEESWAVSFKIVCRDPITTSVNAMDGAENGGTMSVGLLFGEMYELLPAGEACWLRFRSRWRDMSISLC